MMMFSVHQGGRHRPRGFPKVVLNDNGANNASYPIALSICLKGRTGLIIPDFEVKDLRPPEAAALRAVLEFKIRMRFSTAMR